MLDQPPLSEEAIAACLAQGYGVVAERITPLPLGQDRDAAVYRVVAADGAAYFLKVRRPPVDELSLALPHWLRDGGFEQVVAPLPATGGALWRPAGDVALLLYPYIEGRTGMDAGLTPGQWEAFGAALRRLHATALSPALARIVPRERFILEPRLAGVVRALLAGRHEARATDEPARDLAAFVRGKRAEIGRLLRRADELGSQLQGRNDAFVLCHADIHINNVLVDGVGQLRIVDWDQPIVAPRERDLMFPLGPSMRGAMLGSPEGAAFWRGYGAHAIDPLVMAYYRHERAVQDLGYYAELVYWMPERSAAARRDAGRRFKSGFDPGRLVAEAFRSDPQPPRT